MQGKKNILFICSFNPFSESSGAHQRTTLILKAISQSYNVDILYFNHHDCKIDTVHYKNYSIYEYHISQKETIYSKMHQLFYFRGPNAIVRRNSMYHKIFYQLINHKSYDYYFFRYSQLFCECGIDTVPDYSKTIIDVDDLPWKVTQLMSKMKGISILKKIYLHWRGYAIEKGFSNIIKKIHHAFLANQEDCLWENSSCLPNIPVHIKEDNEISKTKINTNILFVGNMKYPPNYYGVEHFIKNIYPSILKEIPYAQLYIAGKGTPESLLEEWKQYDNVHYLGFVEDLEGIYNKCLTVISPIYLGAGTNIKVLEALSMNKICIVSSYSMRGFSMYFKDGRDILIAKDDEDYIKKLTLVLSNPSKYLSIAQNGFSRIKEYFSFEIFQAIIIGQLK